MSQIEHIADILCELFEVLIHNILYHRKLYPESIFHLRKKYNVLVYQSEHPLLNEYLNGVLRAVHFHVRQKQLKQLLLYVMLENRVLEKFVFDVVQMENILDDDPFLVKIEGEFRSFLLKLNASSNYLKPLPDDAEFSVKLNVSEFSAHLYNESAESSDFPWIHTNDDANVPNCKSSIVPVHTLNLNSFVLQVYIEKPFD